MSKVKIEQVNNLGNPCSYCHEGAYKPGVVVKPTKYQYIDICEECYEKVEVCLLCGIMTAEDNMIFNDIEESCVQHNFIKISEYLRLNDILEKSAEKIDKVSITIEDVDKENKLSDDHYREQSIQPIEVQEQIIENNTNVPTKARHLICMSIKHIIRCGQKSDNNPWEKEIRKAVNYLFRALTGKWIHEVDDLNKYLR